MKPLRIGIIAAYLIAALSPTVDPYGIAIARERSEFEKLDGRLRQQARARVLTRQNWLIVKHPRATGDSLVFASVLEPEGMSAEYGRGLLWAQVDTVQVRASGAGWGALVGGVIVGAAGGIIGGAVSSEVGVQPSGNPDPGSIAGGIALGGFFGALLGAGIGSAFKRWVRVYPR